MKTNSTAAIRLTGGGHKVRYMLVALSLTLCQMAPTQAEADVDISIGFNVPTYPNLVPVPGYPVYYDPSANSNYFFYDGQYWVYDNDNWYTSSWYNGPWELTPPDVVPLFVLRVPVRYYRRPPVYFHGWVADRPPHWGEHWGNDWREHHNGWNHWDHNNAPHAAPLPAYQRQYSGDRYPHAVEQQHNIGSQNYHYQPHAQAAPQQHVQQPAHQAVQQRPQAQMAPRPQAEPHPQAAAPNPQAAVPRPQAAPQQHPQGHAEEHPQPHGDDHQGHDQGHDQGQGHDDHDHH
jgi:hypothetical protein